VRLCFLEELALEGFSGEFSVRLELQLAVRLNVFQLQRYLHRETIESELTRLRFRLGSET
jgi:hypothetical protein